MWMYNAGKLKVKVFHKLKENQGSDEKNYWKRKEKCLWLKLQ